MPRQSRAPLIWFGIAWIAFGIAFLYSGVHGLAARDLLRGGQARGVEVVTGTVIRKIVSRADGLTGARTYSIDFRYVTKGGASVQSHALLDRNSWDVLAELGSIHVAYLRAHPETRAIHGEPDNEIMWWLFTILGGIITLVGVLVLGYNVARLLRLHVIAAGAR